MPDHDAVSNTSDAFLAFARRVLVDKAKVTPHPAAELFIEAYKEHPTPKHPWTMFHGRKGSYWVCRRCGVRIGKPAVKLTLGQWLDWHLRRKHAKRRTR
jgi:hypothetical protein